MVFLLKAFVKCLIIKFENNTTFRENARLKIERINKAFNLINRGIFF